ncbi:XdhC family protein [Microbacterium sp.]|uniref:XdhC family protein n=1 Tax=Microbacterium sp. TaxID=51671 RepID=UPI003F99F0EF
MKGILPVAAQWLADGRRFAIATVVGVRRSAPREIGASMLISEDGAIFGNVSGGCVDSDVASEGELVLAGAAPRILSYGIDDDPLLGIGLTCGGEIDVLVRAVAPNGDTARQLCALAAAPGAAVGLALSVSGDDLGHSWIVGDEISHAECPPRLSRILTDAAAHVRDDRASILTHDAEGCAADDAPASVVVVPLGAAPRLIIVGAVEFAVSLSALGTALGFRCTVVDARSAFASADRFPSACVEVSWPDRYLAGAALDPSTAVCVLTHDARFDVPALQAALGSAAGYVGAMGSRRTHEDRLRRLRGAGVSDDQIGRLRSPIGLDLGGRSAEETALSILAEVVAVRNGGTGAPLSETSGAIHASRTATRVS